MRLVVVIVVTNSQKDN